MEATKTAQEEEVIESGAQFIYFEAQESFLSGKKVGLIEMGSNRIDDGEISEAKWRRSIRLEQNPKMVGPSSIKTARLYLISLFSK